MGSSLVIVESPSKAKTINKILGKAYIVKSSVGHVRDLPKSKLGIDVDKDFAPTYVTLKDKVEIIEDLRKAAGKADAVYIASDPDREGEAIGWHLAELLKEKNSNIQRVLFHEITKTAVTNAFLSPRPINHALVEAQQARRILDRLVGYKISPLLWKAVKQGLSAGRVQSVALRMLVEREKDIRAFTPEEYWTITALLQAKIPPAFEARLSKWDGKKADPRKEEQAKRIVDGLKGVAYVVTDVEKKDRKRHAPAPFITSTLQQEASRRYGFGASRTMRIAQGLYEGVDIGDGPVGLITYMRTDSTRVADEALVALREMIKKSFGASYLPAKPNTFKTKKSAQDAHEAIRPTDVTRTPEAMAKFLERDQARLYDLIWKRFVASQMNPAEFEATTVFIEAGKAEFRASGQVLQFEGYLKVYGKYREEHAREQAAEAEERADKGIAQDDDSVDLPKLAKGDKLDCQKVTPLQHFTKPPARYSEATLIKALEERGIGRPSTYASILGVIQGRDYVSREKRTLFPTDLGILVSDLLVKNFPDVINETFTAAMESNLDRVEDGELDWTKSVREFYNTFDSSIQKAELGIREDKKEMIKTDVVCPACGSAMVKRFGKRGAFLGCTNYPTCNGTLPIDFKPGDAIPDKAASNQPEMTDYICQICGEKMVKRMGRFGPFLSCSQYPKCKGTRPIPSGITCPKPGCGGEVSSKRSKKGGKTFYGCSNYPKCDFTTWQKPVKRDCEKCGWTFFTQKPRTKTLVCGNPECGNTVELEGAEAEAAAE